MREPDSDCPEVAGPQCGLDLRRPRRGRRPQTSRSGTWALRLPLAALWMLRAACGRAFRANRCHPNDQHEPLAGPPQPRFRTPPRLLGNAVLDPTAEDRVYAPAPLSATSRTIHQLQHAEVNLSPEHR